MSKDYNSESYSSDEGVSLGRVGSYVKRFKDQEKTNSTINFNPKKQFLNEDDRKEKNFIKNKIHSDPNELPENMEGENEKKVYVYYYCKFGNLDCDDFENVKSKIASAINRLFSKNLTPLEVLVNLEKYVSPADIIIDDITEENKIENFEEKKFNKKEKLSEIKLDIPEGNYDFIKGLIPLTEAQKDLCSFISPENLCFSSDGNNFFVSVKPSKSDCFDKIFNFSKKEELIFNMFKDQLGDEHKAKKLVLMSRMLNEDKENNKKMKKR